MTTDRDVAAAIAEVADKMEADAEKAAPKTVPARLRPEPYEPDFTKWVAKHGGRQT